MVYCVAANSFMPNKINSLGINVSNHQAVASRGIGKGVARAYAAEGATPSSDGQLLRLLRGLRSLPTCKHVRHQLCIQVLLQQRDLAVPKFHQHMVEVVVALA